MMRATGAAAALPVSLLPGLSVAQTAPTPGLNHADTHELVSHQRAAGLDSSADLAEPVSLPSDRLV